jgi:hypothetical protein
MKHRSFISLSIAALSVILVLPSSAQDSSLTGTGDSADANSDATHMVPATAALKTTYDTDKLKLGDPFNIALSASVKLQNGPKLPSGTVILGTVTTDDLNINGAAKLALRFTQAKLKNGQVIPIKATIVGVYAPETTNASGSPITPGDQYPNLWTPQTVNIDQVEAISGVDLHSRISSINSGVFVSTKKNDVRLAVGSEIALAIAQDAAATQASSATTQSNP